MLSVYVIALLFGGVLLAASLLGGHGDAHAHLDGDHGGSGDSHPHAGWTAGSLWPLMSTRFWLLGATFFGLVGTVATLTGARGPFVPITASLVGLVCGYGGARLLGQLARRSVGLVQAAEAHVGREGRLLLPVSRSQRGKLRVVISGRATDLLAETDGDELLPAGSQALVVSIRGNVALVERAPTARLSPASESGAVPGSEKEPT